MANLKINTKRLRSVVICGDFCNWDMDLAIVANKCKGVKYITIDNMPQGEYKVFDAKGFVGSEVYPKDKRPMGNRYFSGSHDDLIDVYFKEDYNG